MALLARVPSSVLLSPGMEPVRINPADLPALEVQLGALVLLLSITLVFGFAPLCMVRAAGRCSVDSELHGLVGCFTGGVFLATCLLDLLPVCLQGISRAVGAAGITLQFPLPEFIVAMGFFLVLVLEQMVLTFKDQPSVLVEEHQGLLGDARLQAGYKSGRRHVHVDFSSQAGLRAFVLVLSLSLHSMFEGVAVGLQEDGRRVLETCLVLVIQKSVLSFSLTFKLVQDRLRRTVVVGCMLLFAVMSPLGVALGVGLSEASPQHQLSRSTLEGLVTGTFVYVTFMEILPHELGAVRNRLLKVTMLLVGFALVTAVLFIKL